MKKQNFYLLLVLFASATLYWECRTSAKTQHSAPAGRLLASFAAMSGLSDTLHFFLPEKSSGNAVSDTLLKTCLDRTQYENLHFDTGEAYFWALGRFPLTENVEACLLQTEEFWFGKQALLLYDKKARTFTSTLEVTSFYGGDGGQTAVESWLFRHPALPRIFLKSAEHGFSMRDGEEPAEYLSETGTLLQWQSKAFIPVANADSSIFLQKLRMDREW